jgi:DnaD/phage-associated family protein
VYHLKNGGYAFEVMSFEDCMEHGKRYSKTYRNGPWQTAPEEMAKKTVLKRLLKYAPMKTEFITDDEKVLDIEQNDGEIKVISEDIIEADYAEIDKMGVIEYKYGMVGFGIIVKLYQKIYSNGYYCDWDDDVIGFFAHETFTDESTVNEIVAEALKRGIFNRKLFEKYSILTSRGIQTRYDAILKRKKGYGIKPEYDLVSDEIPDASVEENTAAENCGAKERDKAAENCGAKERDKAAENCGAKERDKAAENCGAKERDFAEQIKEKKIKEKEKSKISQNKNKIKEIATVSDGDACGAYDYDLKAILEKLERCNIFPSANTVEAIQSWLSDTDTEIINYAIDRADKQSKRSWAYIEAILKHLKADGLTTMEQIKERDSKYKGSNKRFTDKDTSVFKPDGTDYADIERRMNKLLEDYDEYAAAGIY